MTDEMIEEIKELLPEIDFSNLDEMSGALHDLSLQVKGVENREKALIETLKEMSVLFKANASKLQAFEMAQQVTTKKQMELAEAIVQANMQFLQIDYEALLIAITARYPDWDIALGNEMFTLAEKTLEMPVLIDKVAKKVSIDKQSEIIQDALGEIDTDNLASEVANHVDVSEVADEIWSNYFDPTDHWDTYEIANHFSVDDIAGYIDAEYVAEYVSKSEIAEHLEYNDTLHEEIAKRVSADLIAKKLDLDTIVAKVAKSLQESIWGRFMEELGTYKEDKKEEEE